MEKERIRKKMIRVPENWILWTIFESGIRTINRTFQKILGGLSKTFPVMVVALLMNSFLYITIGLIRARYKKQSLSISRKRKYLAAGRAITSSSMMFFSLGAFIFVGADMGIVTFLGSLSVIPGSAFDRALFKTRLSTMQLLGIVIYIIAGYAVLNFPGTGRPVNYGIWVLCGIGIAMGFAINEVISKKLRGLGAKGGEEEGINPDAGVYTFYVGVYTLVIASTLLIGFLAITQRFNALFEIKTNVWLILLALALFASLSVLASLAAYTAPQKERKTFINIIIAYREVLMKTLYLSAVTVIGIVFMSEPLTEGKMVAIPLYAIALLLVSRKKS